MDTDCKFSINCIYVIRVILVYITFCLREVSKSEKKLMHELSVGTKVEPIWDRVRTVALVVRKI